MQHETELDPMDLPFDLEADIGIIKEASLEWQRSIKKYCENTNLCQVNGKYETSM